MSDLSSRDFAQDFLEEARDHLQAISRNLLALEQLLVQPGLDRPAPSSPGSNGGLGAGASQAAAPQSSAPQSSAPQAAALINHLFRSFHTLKGLSGMIGLAQGEQLSHALESVLRSIERGDQSLTHQVIDHLLDGLRLLEAVIDTVRDPLLAAPDIKPYLALIEPLSKAAPNKAAPDKAASNTAAPNTAAPKKADSIKAQPAKAAVPESGNGQAAALVGAEPAALPPGAAELLSGQPELAAALDASGRAQLDAALLAGEVMSVAIFTPSTAKAAQGVNVNQVRQALGESTRLVQAAPLVQGGGIRFAFLVATPASKLPDPSSFPEMEWVSLGSPQPAPAPEAADHPAPPPAPQPVKAHPGSPSPVTVRVDIERLDDLLRLVGDLTVTHSRLAEILPHPGGFRSGEQAQLQQVSGKMARQLRELRQSVVRARMVPLSEVFARMPLTVRDLARQAGKQVSLVLQGEHTEVDRMLVERLLDPLLHLARNAITHGIETPEERLLLGKPPAGLITLSAEPDGDHILIALADDGRGIDLKQLSDHAAALGLRPSGMELTPVEALELLCMPGFTTRMQADFVSGRGMGMDVVRQAVSAVGGGLSLQTTPGKGSTFTLRLPLTLTIVDALIVHCGSERYAVPRKDVDRVVEIDPDLVVRSQAGELMPFRDDVLALARLADLFGLEGRAGGVGLVHSFGDGRLALVVDRISGLREVVVKPVTDPLIARPGISGATEMGDGSVILILDLSTLLRRDLFSGVRKEG